MPVITRSRSNEAARMNRHTHENLLALMKIESLACARYLIFAQKARSNGRYDLAALFEEAATEEHLRRFEAAANLAGLVGSDLDNLGNAISEETDGVSSLYQRFAGEAAMSGDMSAQELFLEISEAQMLHEGAFREALKELESPGHDAE